MVNDVGRAEDVVWSDLLSAIGSIGAAGCGGNPNLELQAVACSEGKGARGGGGLRAGCSDVPRRVCWTCW